MLAKCKHLFFWSYLPKLVRSETITLLDYFIDYISFRDGIAICPTLPICFFSANRVTGDAARNN